MMKKILLVVLAGFLISGCSASVSVEEDAAAAAGGSGGSGSCDFDTHSSDLSDVAGTYAVSDCYSETQNDVTYGARQALRIDEDGRSYFLLAVYVNDTDCSDAATTSAEFEDSGWEALAPTGIPNGVLAFKLNMTDNDGCDFSGEDYVLFASDGSGGYWVLDSIEPSGSTWAQWDSGDSDYGDFAANPANYEPANEWNEVIHLELDPNFPN